MGYCVWIFMAKLGQVPYMSRIKILGLIFILKIQVVDVSMKLLPGDKTSSLLVLSRIWRKKTSDNFIL